MSICKYIRHFLLLLSISIVLPASAKKAAPRLIISHLTGNFYVFTTYRVLDKVPVSANGLYLVTAEGVITIDSPWDTTQFQPLLDSIMARHGKNVIACIATHSHEDRTGGLEFYRSLGVKTYTTKQTDEISMAKGEKRAEFLLSNDTTFSVGGYTFQTYYPGPGHTSDNIVVWFPKQKILYGGCLIKSIDATDLGYVAEANIAQWPLSLQNILRKFGLPRYVIPGHQSWQSAKSIKHTLQLLKSAATKN